MKLLLSKHRVCGFTFIDLLIVLVTVALALVVLATPRRSTCRHRTSCTSNLKKIGLAFMIWSHDHDDKSPRFVSTNQGGSLEYATSREVFRHLLSISNELVSPRVLVCPSDPGRKPGTEWDKFGNGNLSYFVGVDANETQPSTWLSGDRNITTNRRLMSGMLVLSSNSSVSWTTDIHKRAGNIGLADGSVQQMTDALLLGSIQQSSNLPTRLAIP